MALIFFQIAPVHTVSDLGNRLLALLASFGIVFLFAWFLSLNTTVQNRLKALISDGFDVCKELLTQTGCITADSHSAQNETSEQVPELHKKLCTINQHISREIYSANRATLRLKGKTNWYCRFVLVFQIINYLTDHAQEDNNQQTARGIYEKFYAQFQEIEPATDYRRLNFRIRKNGGKIYLNHNIRVQYYCRDTMRGIMKMGYMNGKWNVITMTLVPGSMGVRHFVPLAFVLSTILLVLLTLLTKSMLFGGLLALEWGAYLLLDFFYSYTIAKEKGWKFLPVEIILYPAFHFAYGFGSLCGIAALPKFVRAEKEKKKAGDGR